MNINVGLKNFLKHFFKISYNFLDSFQVHQKNFQYEIPISFHYLVENEKK